MSVCYSWKELFEDFFSEVCSYKETIDPVKTKFIFNSYKYWLEDRDYALNFSIQAFARFFPKAHPEFKRIKKSKNYVYKGLFINDERIQKEIIADVEHKRLKNNQHQTDKRERDKIMIKRGKGEAVGYNTLADDPIKWKADDVDMNTLYYWLTRMAERLRLNQNAEYVILMSQYLDDARSQCDGWSKISKKLENKILWKGMFDSFKGKILQSAEEYLKAKKEDEYLLFKVKVFLYDKRNKDILDELLLDFKTGKLETLAATHFKTCNPNKIVVITRQVIKEHFERQIEEEDIINLSNKAFKRNPEPQTSDNNMKVEKDAHIIELEAKFAEIKPKVKNFLYSIVNKRILINLINDYSSDNRQKLAKTYFPDYDEDMISAILNSIAANYFDPSDPEKRPVITEKDSKTSRL